MTLAMKSINALTAQAVEDPESFATLGEADTRRVMARLLEVAGVAYRSWVEKSDSEQLAKHRARGDRLLDTKELKERLGCSRSTLMRGWKSGQYPFILKDGSRLVGSEDGLARWIKNRTDRKFSRN